MQTVEIIVYMSIAVIVGGLVIGFLVGMDTQSMYSTLSGLFNREPEVRYRNLEAHEVAPAVFNLWESCGFGEFNETLIVGLTGDQDLNKTVLFQSVIRYNLCHSLQWNESVDQPEIDVRCGDRDDVELSGDISPDTLLVIQCDNTSRTINITELS